MREQTMAKTAEEYLVRKSVCTDKGCVEFSGPFDKDGYGKLWSTKWFKQYRTGRAHQLSYRLTFGEYDRTLCVCHKCHNRACIKPEHLYLGTVQDNNRDRELSGRTLRGEQNGFAKLSEEQVIFIKANYKIYTQSQLANMFSVTRGCIWKIINGYSWKHVPR